MAEKSIGVPTAKSMGSSFKHAAYGAGSAFIVQIAQNFLGSGLFGTLAGILLAGAILKGPEGVAISTILGYNAIAGGGGLGGLLGEAQQVLKALEVRYNGLTGWAIRG